MIPSRAKMIEMLESKKTPLTPYEQKALAGLKADQREADAQAQSKGERPR